MRYSTLFGKTLRDKPRNAGARSHELLLRAGFLRATESGFLLLPLGQRVLNRIRAIVHGELHRAGAAHAGFNAAGKSEASRNLRFARRERGGNYPFAEAHEASLGALAGSLNLSYRDLPLRLAGERWAARDDAHLGWGLLASPELLLHAAYAFGGSPESEPLRASYRNALKKCGVDAFDLGDEFAVATELPARPLLACTACGYRAGAESAVSRTPEWLQTAELLPREDVYGPGLIQVEPLAEFLKIPVHQTTKTLLFEIGGRVVAACVAGHYGVSESKLARLLGCRGMELAAPDTVRELTQSDVGYAGPAGLPESVEVIWDLTTEHRVNFEAGANRSGYHTINLNFGRDLPRPARFADIRTSLAGEPCAQCAEGKLEAGHALTIGHVSELGEQYSETLGARFLDTAKTTRPLSLTCAGLDLTATLAAAVEQNQDARGIRWPASIAPFAAHLVSLPPSEPAAESLYNALTGAGVEVLWDDRTESAGVKFGDADLIGIPVRLVLSKRTGDQVEWKSRAAEQGELIAVEEAMRRLRGSGMS